jgi:hypothetical protein
VALVWVLSVVAAPPVDSRLVDAVTHQDADAFVGCWTTGGRERALLTLLAPNWTGPTAIDVLK